MKILTSSLDDIKIASNMLKEGKLVAFPTETVYGVASIYGNDNALISLHKLKRRASDKPYTCMISSPTLIKNYAIYDSKIEKFLNKVLPGSVTVILKAKENLWQGAFKDGLIGFRVPTNKEALDLLKEVKLPLLVPSLNRSNEQPMYDINAIKQEFDFDLDAIIQGEIKENIPSTVISLVNGIHIIREGKVPFTELENLYKSL